MLQTINDHMTPEQFVYWLQGKLENHEGKLSTEDIKSIKDHLAQVFCKRTPNTTVTTYPPTDTGKIQTWKPEPGTTFIC